MPSTPEPLPSLPPSPVEEPTPRRPARHEEEVGRAWHDDEPDANAARKGKGKGRTRRMGKRRAVGSGDDDDDEDDDDEDEDEDENAGSGALEGYPPTKEEEADCVVAVVENVDVGGDA